MTTAPSYLPPAAFHEHITSTTVNPAVTHPNGVRMWRTLPAARSPDIGISVPLVVATDPDITTTGSGHPPFNNVSGRADLHEDFFRMKRSNTYREREQRRGQKFTHVDSPFTSPTTTGRLRIGACFAHEPIEAIN